MAAIGLKCLYLINYMLERGMQYVIFYILGVNDSNFTNRNVVAAMYVEKIVKWPMVAIATGKHNCQ